MDCVARALTHAQHTIIPKESAFFELSTITTTETSKHQKNSVEHQLTMVLTRKQRREEEALLQASQELPSLNDPSQTQTVNPSIQTPPSSAQVQPSTSRQLDAGISSSHVPELLKDFFDVPLVQDSQLPSSVKAVTVGDVAIVDAGNNVLSGSDTEVTVSDTEVSASEDNVNPLDVLGLVESSDDAAPSTSQPRVVGRLLDPISDPAVVSHVFAPHRFPPSPEKALHLASASPPAKTSSSEDDDEYIDWSKQPSRAFSKSNRHDWGMYVSKLTPSDAMDFNRLLKWCLENKFKILDQTVSNLFLLVRHLASIRLTWVRHLALIIFSLFFFFCVGMVRHLVSIHLTLVRHLVFCVFLFQCTKHGENGSLSDGNYVIHYYMAYMGKHDRDHGIDLFRVLMSTFVKNFWSEFEEVVERFLAPKKLTFAEWGQFMRGDVCVDELGIYIMSVLTNKHTLIMTTEDRAWSSASVPHDAEDCHLLVYRGGNRYWIVVPESSSVAKVCRTKRKAIDPKIQEMYDASTEEESPDDNDSDFVPTEDDQPCSSSTPSKKPSTRSQAVPLVKLPSPIRTRSRASIEKNLRPPKPSEHVPGIPIPAESIAAARTRSQASGARPKVPSAQAKGKGKGKGKGKSQSTPSPKPKPPKRLRTESQDDQQPSTSQGVTSGPLPCPVEGCTRTFKYPSFLKTHLTTHQKSTAKYRCEENVDDHGTKCGRTFTYRPDLVRHQAAHGGATLRCPREGCPYETTRGQKTMTEHEISHEIKDGKRPKPTCKKCGDTFVYRSALSRHQRLCDGPTCDLCMRKFPNIDAYNAHIPTCHGHE